MFMENYTTGIFKTTPLSITIGTSLLGKDTKTLG